MNYKELEAKHGRPILHSKIAGITRALFYSAGEPDVRIYVEDKHSNFVLDPPVFLAIDAYRNPHLYRDAAMNGITNPRRLNPANLAGDALLGKAA